MCEVEINRGKENTINEQKTDLVMLVLVCVSVCETERERVERDYCLGGPSLRMSSYCCWNSIGLISKEACVCACVHVCAQTCTGMCVCLKQGCCMWFCSKFCRQEWWSLLQSHEKTDIRVTHHTNLGNGECFSPHPQQSFISAEQLSPSHNSQRDRK